MTASSIMFLRINLVRFFFAIVVPFIFAYAQTQCGTRVCQNNGQCITLDNQPVCQCNSRFFGFDCSLPRCEPFCSNGGKCIAKEAGRHVCKCRKGFSGPSCRHIHAFTGNCLYVRRESSSVVYISSPNKQYGIPTYFPNARCSLVVKADTFKISARFIEMDLETTLTGECTQDRLKVFENNKLLTTACGKGLTGGTFNTTKQFRFEWRTDGTGEGTGFVIRVEYSGGIAAGMCEVPILKKEQCFPYPDGVASLLGSGKFCIPIPPLVVGKKCECCAGYGGEGCESCIKNECIIKKYALRSVKSRCDVMEEINLFGFFPITIKTGERDCFKQVRYVSNTACTCCNGYSGRCGKCKADLLSLQSCGVSNGQLTNDLSGRIVNGGAATAGEWPWQVAIEEQGSLICGGTIINHQWIVSAAQCFHGKSLAPSQWSIVAGTIDLRDRSSGQVLRPSKIIIHPNYKDALNPLNDIALIKLETPLNFNNNLKPACIPSGERNLVGEVCIITGWGKMAESDSSTVSTLREAGVPIVAMSDCRQANPQPTFEIRSTNICAGRGNGGPGTCLGDSGGPLVCQLDGKWNLVGITSWGQGCAAQPEVFTRVFSFRSWIVNTLSKN